MSVQRNGDIKSYSSLIAESEKMWDKIWDFSRAENSPKQMATPIKYILLSMELTLSYK